MRGFFEPIAFTITVQLDLPQRDFAGAAPSENRLQNVFAVWNLRISPRWPAEIVARLVFPRARSKFLVSRRREEDGQSNELPPRSLSMQYLAASQALLSDIEQRCLAPHPSKENWIHPTNG